MQTFLPYQDFSRSAECLDRQRLGKQRVEVLQLLRALTGETKGWANHPACLMWRGHIHELAVYGIECCTAWISRGYKDTCREKMMPYLNHPCGGGPSWLGDEEFHASHRSNLLRKNRDYYSRFGWTEPDDLPYIWPRP
jgi:hypothetical protein